tara:strand:- start:12993 stop:13484 length:492 start_codon:yes stop_codon:yes gene_type:complete
MTYFQDMWQLAIQGETQGVWFWAAIYTLIVCTYSLVFQIRTRYWPPTLGELNDIRVKRFGPKVLITYQQDYTSKAFYQYEVSGVTYEGTRISPWVFVASHNARFVLEKQMASVQRTTDGKVKVFYNPNNPQKSYLIIAGRIGIAITLLISALPLISFYFKYYV